MLSLVLSECDWCACILLKFGNRGSLEQHGFARNKMWVIDDNPPPLHPNDSNGKTYIDLLLKSSDDDLKIWPHGYELYNPFLFLIGNIVILLWSLVITITCLNDILVNFQLVMLVLSFLFLQFWVPPESGFGFWWISYPDITHQEC